MTKRKPKPHAKVGRPTEFRPEYCEQAEKLCRLGATDLQLADFFGVAVSTISKWKIECPEFSEALKAGKLVADMAVANALFKKATGYTRKVDRVIGKGDDQEVVQVELAFEPDTTAAIFWLKNRRREHWRDKIDHEQSGKVLLEIVRVTRSAQGRPT